MQGRRPKGRRRHSQNRCCCTNGHGPQDLALETVCLWSSPAQGLISGPPNIDSDKNVATIVVFWGQCTQPSSSAQERTWNSHNGHCKAAGLP